MRSSGAYMRAWIVAVATTGPAVVPSCRSFAQEPSPVAPAAAPEPATGPGASGLNASSASAGRLGPGSQATGGSNLETYRLLRYDEDYSYLKDPSRRTDPLDVLKYIPLGQGDDTYLSLGGTARPRYESYHNPDFGAGPADRHGYNDDLLQRYLLHGDLHLGPSVRFFGQLQSGFETG